VDGAIKGSFKRKHCSPVRDTSYADGIKNKKQGLTLNIVPFISNFTSEARVLVTEDRTETSTDKEGARHTVLKHTTYERTFSLEIDGGDEILYRLPCWGDLVDGAMLLLGLFCTPFSFV
jgi:hypothetical protein